MVKGVAGQLTGNSSPYSSESMILEKSNAPFGVVLVSDSDGVCRLPDKSNVLTKGASIGVAVGVLVKQDPDGMPCNTALTLPIGNGETNYAKDGFVVSLAREGNVFVKTETDVTRNDQVFYRVVSTATQSLGALRKDIDAGKAVKLTGAVFMESASAGDIVEIALNLNVIQETY